MRKYKPEYLGRVITPDDSEKMTDFVQNKYESFSKIYDTCKHESENILDVQAIESTSKSNDFSMRIVTDDETLKSITEKTQEEDGISISGNIVTASS